MLNEPLSPINVVPELNVSAPDRPVVAALAVRMVRSPLDFEPSPVAMRMVPVD